MRLRLVACCLAFLLPAAGHAFSPGLDTAQAQSEDTSPAESGAANPPAAADPPAADPPTAGAAEEGLGGLPTILRSESELPEPVRQMRLQLMEAARSGDIEQLRALMRAQPEMPAVSFGDPGDPIEYLKALSSDAEGREILAILLEVLESGFVRVAPGAASAADEFYVWPYFAQYPVEALTPEQLVELFTLLTAADYEDMRSYGSYTSFRVGIAPDGTWLFFLAGD